MTLLFIFLGCIFSVLFIVFGSKTILAAVYSGDFKIWSRIFVYTFTIIFLFGAITSFYKAFYGL